MSFIRFKIITRAFSITVQKYVKYFESLRQKQELKSSVNIYSDVKNGAVMTILKKQKLRSRNLRATLNSTFKSKNLLKAKNRAYKEAQ